MTTPAAFSGIVLKPYREYPTFQALYELHPKNGATREGVFKKTVLIVMDWIRNKTKDTGSSFLEQYPAPENYNDFDIEGVPDIAVRSPFDITTVYRSAEPAWAFRIIEPSSVKANQSFRTEIGLKMQGETVLLGICTHCREEHQAGTALADSWRLQFICNVLMNDPDMNVTEYGVDYPLKAEPLKLNGKSKGECEELKEKLIYSVSRRLPVLVFKEAVAPQIAASFDDSIRRELKGCCYMVAVADNLNKLFITALNRKDLVVELAGGTKFLVITDPASLGGMQPVELVKAPDADGMDPGNLKYMRDLIKNYHRGKSYDYCGVSFLSELRSKKLLDTLPQGSSPEDAKRIEALVEEYNTAVREHEVNEAALLEANEKLQKEKSELEAKLKQAHRSDKTEEFKLKYEDSLSDIKDLKANIQALEAEKKELRENALKLRVNYRGLASIPLPVNTSRDAVIAWIENNYADCLIVSERAKDEFRSDKRQIDLGIICRMIHYLYGYTFYMNRFPGEAGKAAEMAKEYDVLSENWEATNVGRAPLMHDKNAGEYDLDISAYDPGKGIVQLDKHIKNGIGRDESMLRIYFYYDRDIGKSIIGSMPGHLENGMR